MTVAPIRELKKLLGPAAVLHRPEDLLLYEYDGSVEKGRPDAVVFPSSTEEVSRVVKLAAQHEIPIVGRGAGTGLSGGALARNGGIMIAFARMNRILELDLENQRAVVQPGVINFDLTRAVEHAGLYFAPDPSSQKSCTIGGNVAENAGGPHTLAYGVTSNHVTSLELVLPDGEIFHIGTAQGDSSGYDLAGLFVGSEGTLALVTQITVKLSRKPEAVKTLLAIFDTVDDASETVAEIIHEVGGSLTGEHGVGMEKSELMSLLFSDADFALMRRVHDAFNPHCSLNPGKVLPLNKGCGETRIRPQSTNPPTAAAAP